MYCNVIHHIEYTTTKNLLALEDACRELVSTEQERRSSKEGAPRLAKPKMTFAQASSGASVNKHPAEEVASARDGANLKMPSKTAEFNASASLIGSMATLRQLLHDGNLEELRGRLKMINTESAALRTQGDKLLSALEKSTNELQNAVNKAEECHQAWQQSKDMVQDLTQQQQGVKSQLVGNHEKLTKTQQKLDQKTSDLKTLGTPSQTPAQRQHQLLTDTVTGLHIRQSALQARYQRSSNSLTALEGMLTKTELSGVQLKNTYEQALKQSADKAVQANNNRIKINNFIDNSIRRPPIEGERWESSLALLTLLTLLTAQLKKMMNDDSIKNMRQQQEVMETINEASRKDSEKKAKEAEAAQRKADEANKAASCASKIFGYVMLAVSVVATISSFGTAAPLTMAIAAIGIAMTVTDIILAETGNSSLMQMLATEISTGITNMLIQCGVPEEKAKEIGGIMGMVLAAVAFLAISLFSLSSFAKNIGQTVANLAKNASKQVANLMKSAVKALPRDLLSAVGKMGSKATNLSKPLAKIADKANDLGRVTNVTARKVEMGLSGVNYGLKVSHSYALKVRHFKTGF
ncbi:MAG: type III secretion system translocon subunit SctE [Yersinia sp. (in: enterobacteria)]